MTVRSSDGSRRRGVASVAVRTVVVVVSAALAPSLTKTANGAGSAPSPHADVVQTPAPSTFARSSVLEKDGIRVRVTLTRNPLVAGEPTWVRTKVRNVGDAPIIWPGGRCGTSVYVSGEMTEATWRSFDIVPEPTRGPDGGYVRPVNDLRWRVQDDSIATSPTIQLWFEAAEGSREERGCGDMYVETRIPPGGIVVQRRRWDGTANGGLGPPPSGPVLIAGSFSYRLPGRKRSRTIEVPLDAWVIDGRHPDWLEPMEAVDAALAAAELRALIETVDLGYDSDAYVAFDPDREVWVIGACGWFDGEHVHWRAGLVDPRSGEVVEVVDRPGGGICEVGPLP